MVGGVETSQKKMLERHIFLLAMQGLRWRANTGAVEKRTGSYYGS